MSLRIATLLGLSALAACSNTTSESARDPSQATSSASPDADMRPASLDERRASATGTDATSGNRAASAAHTTAPRPASDPLGPSTTGAADQPGSARSTSDGTTSTSSAAAASPSPGPTAPAGTQPDNTKVNERDTSSAALTPVDQGNNETDLKITQQIRQAVMANDSLSFTAKNVKIITNGGKVTLRGPVKTAAERDAIDAAARKVAGTQVDNQIEVKK